MQERQAAVVSEVVGMRLDYGERRRSEGCLIVVWERQRQRSEHDRQKTAVRSKMSGVE